jgi:acylphosphatase
MIQRRVYANGRVQGVGYRASAYREACRHPGVRGWVKNLPDGRVEAVFCGSETAVGELVEWCRRGPRSARVERLDVLEEEPDTALGRFEVEPDDV